MNDVFFKALTGIDVPKLNMIPIIRYIVMMKALIDEKSGFRSHNKM